MSSLRLTLPGNEIPINGKQVSFRAPCQCSNIDCLVIDGVEYKLVDAKNRVVNKAFVQDTLVTVVLDVTNALAYVQNGLPDSEMIVPQMYTSDFFMYVSGKHPILNSGPYSDYYETRRRSLSLSGDAQTITIYDN